MWTFTTFYNVDIYNLLQWILAAYSATLAVSSTTIAFYRVIHYNNREII